MRRPSSSPIRELLRGHSIRREEGFWNCTSGSHSRRFSSAKITGETITGGRSGRGRRTKELTVHSPEHFLPRIVEIGPGDSSHSLPPMPSWGTTEDSCEPLTQNGFSSCVKKDFKPGIYLSNYHPIPCIWDLGRGTQV